jgi:hypothetical protein
MKIFGKKLDSVASNFHLNLAVIGAAGAGIGIGLSAAPLDHALISGRHDLGLVAGLGLLFAGLFGVMLVLYNIHQIVRKMLSQSSSEKDQN